MGHPLIHAIVVICAIIIPGGLVLYFIWAANKRKKKKSQVPSRLAIVARNDFLDMFPPESLRAKSRRRQLEKARRIRKFGRKGPPST
jgi:hypothetical protein